jgi:hypothetical protein
MRQAIGLGRAAVSIYLVGSLYGCGGSKPAETPVATAAPSSTASATTTAATAPTAPLSVAEQAEAAPYDDPNEKEGPIDLAPLFAKNAPKSIFPKATMGDHDCLLDLPFTGNHKADYDVLTKRCGAPTGLIPYVTPAEGKLHATKDKRDVFAFEVRKGMCYRYFAVADSGIADIDILVQKPNGALLAMDQTSQPIAVVNTSGVWCMTDDDQMLHFSVEVHGHGAGAYTFGVFARPAK